MNKLFDVKYHMIVIRDEKVKILPPIYLYSSNISWEKNVNILNKCYKNLETSTLDWRENNQTYLKKSLIIDR